VEALEDEQNIVSEMGMGRSASGTDRVGHGLRNPGSKSFGSICEEQSKMRAVLRRE
jgi:hypothetical protein